MVEKLQLLLDDKTKIKSEGDLLTQLLIEVVFTKYGTNQLEHIQRGTDRVKPVLLKRLQNNDHN